MKIINKKTGILLIIILFFLVYSAFHSLLPSVTLINNSTLDLKVTTPQFIGYIEDGELRAGGLPSTSSILEMQKSKGVIKKGEEKSFKLDYFNIPKNFYSAEFPIFSVNWSNNERKVGGVQFEILNNNKISKGVCHVTIIIDNDGYDIIDKSDSFCLKKLGNINL